MARRLWVARLSVSDRTREKIATKHGLDVAELARGLVGVERLEYRWDDDPERGLRAVVTLRLHERRVAVVLYPAPDLGDDCFRLGSAYVV